MFNGYDNKNIEINVGIPYSSCTCSYKDLTIKIPKNNRFESVKIELGGKKYKIVIKDFNKSKKELTVILVTES